MGVDAGQLQAAGVALVACGAAGLFVPALIRSVPEPKPEPRADEPESDAAEPEPRPPRPSKELYADIAALPGLAVMAAVASALAGALVGLTMGWDWSLALLLPVVPVGVALALIDWRTKLLPTRIVLPATGVALVIGTAVGLLDGRTDDLVRGLLGLVAARSLFWVMWWIRSAGMGFGDVRLSALLGFVLGFVGWPEWVVGMYAGFLVFGLPGLTLAIVRRDRSLLRTPFPFGPFMLVGALVGLLSGDWLWSYLAR